MHTRRGHDDDTDPHHTLPTTKNDRGTTLSGPGDRSAQLLEPLPGRSISTDEEEARLTRGLHLDLGCVYAINWGDRHGLSIDKALN